MSEIDLSQSTIESLSKLIKQKEISPVELATATLNRIDKLESRIKAFVTITREEAMETAQAAEKAVMAGEPLTACHGIPIAFKDIYCTKGIKTTAGSKVLGDFVPAYDATVVSRLRSAGATVMGKTNTHEFAFGVVTSPTGNAWNQQHMPGGSSGGSAAAVAADLCVAATATDTAGSIRIPAALNGVVGIKPTYGRVSKHGIIPLSWSLDHAGPITKTTRDAALMLNIISGNDPLDATTLTLPSPDYTAQLDESIAGMKLGIPKEYFFDIIDPEVNEAFQQAVRVLEGLGAIIEEVSLPSAALSSLVGYYTVLPEAASYHENHVKQKAHLYEPGTLALIKMGSFMLASHFIKAQRLRRMMSMNFNHVLQQVDAIITPTVPFTAPPIGQTEFEFGPVKAPLMDVMIRNTIPANVLGLPAISVPCGFSTAKLPIGLQIIGRNFDETGILKIANNYEQNTEWHRHKPQF